MRRIPPGLFIALGIAAAGGALLLSRTRFARSLGAPVGSDGDAARVSKADVRDGWAPRVHDAIAPKRWGMVGCRGWWFIDRPDGGRTTNSPGAAWYLPGLYATTNVGQVAATVRAGRKLDLRDCALEGVAPVRGQSAGVRSWWQPINGPLPSESETDAEILADDGAPGEVVQVMGVTVGGGLYVRSDQTRNFASLSVRGGTLWVGRSGWFAVDANGRDIERPAILYKGQSVPAAVWPGALEPWASVYRGSRWTPMIAKGDRHHSGGHVAPYDVAAPVYLWALLSRPRLRAADYRKGKGK